MAKICFVSYEIHPVTPGGCGVLLYNSARVLLEQGHEIIFLFDMPSDDFANFEPQSYPNGHNCRAYLVEDLCADITRHVQDFSSEYSWRAYRFHWATQHVYDTERPDLIEFFDYNGVAHYALSAKITNSAYNQSCLVVRLHNPDQLINRYQPQTYLTHDEYTIYALEHSALRMAEVVLYPSLSYLDKAYRPHYEPWLGQTIHSKPALSNFPKLSESGQPKNRILFYGRLFGFKGVDLLVDAGVKFLSENGLEAPCFTFVGYDSSATPDGSQTYITSPAA